MSNKKITFFMLVTNYDILIANYAIYSYQKIFDVDNRFGKDNFTLLIYSNCLTKANKEKYFPLWSKLPYVEIFDNSEKVKNLYLKAGDQIVSPEGVIRNRDSSCENYDELWSTELRKIQTPYYATVDADFEILRPEFYFNMMNELENDEKLAGYSCTYGPTNIIFDSYSNETIILSERYSTCFCIYKKNTQACPVSHFYYQFILPNGMRFAYDSAAYFQFHLIHKMNYRFKAVIQIKHYQFIHYGAFSKNSYQ